MRFQRLSIPAFGPFTDLNLSFPNAGHDLHVIYGENEAGKSSLLRAIRDLLFGIDVRSTDNFLHDYKNLRLIGEIENRAGQRLHFQRRKGNKNTLLDAEDGTLPDGALVPFLGSVDASYFSTMFGLGSGELRDGARELLQGKGEIGNALFSASLGGTPIQRVVDAITEESEQLFKGRASTNVSIRPAVNRYKELIKQSREAVISADAWEQLEKEIERQQAERERLEGEIATYEQELDWVGRCTDSLPTIGKYNAEMAMLRELPALPEVGSDFVTRARSARDDLKASTRKVEELSSRRAQLQARLEQCLIAPEVLEVEDSLDALHQDLGAYRTRKETKVTLLGKLAGIEPALRTGMQSLGIQGEFESLESLRLDSATRLRVEKAANDLIEAERHRDDCEGKTQKLKSQTELQNRELESLPEMALEPLREALAIAAEATDASKTLETSRAAVESLKRKVQDAQTLVIGAPVDPDAIAKLPVPSSSTIRRFRERLNFLEQDEKAATNKVRDEEGKVRKLREELVRLERRGELPTEDSLRKARDHRDHGWELVMKEWKGEGTTEVLEAGTVLEEAFPNAVKTADQIADRLRMDAESVAQAEEKRLQIEAAVVAIETASAEVETIRTAKRERLEAWASEWNATGVAPRSPDEMESWREDWVRFRETLTKLREAEDAFESKARQVQKATDALAAVLKDSPAKPFAILFDAARKQVQHGEEATGRRKEIVRQVTKSENDMRDALLEGQRYAGTAEAARTGWIAECKEVGLPADTPSASGLALIQERKELVAKFDQWKELSSEVAQTSDAMAAFECNVSALSVQFGIESDSIEAKESTLWKKLTSARSGRVDHDQLTAQLKEADERLVLGRDEASRARQSLDELVALAGIQSPEELEPLLAGLEKRTSISSRIESYRIALGGLARGEAVEDFIARSEAENADELPQRKARVETSKAEKKNELQTIRDALSESKRKRDELAEAGDAAADYRQQAESTAATLILDATRFIRLRLAAHFLREQIEQFRKENQGPLLEKSGKVFSQITRGAFEGLAAEFNEQDVPVLMGRRMDGTNVPVDGMSEGTRDQLYLALRLAALDRHLENHEPMPLILDDLLMTFDNARAGAILPQLAVLSKHTQVFLFTHHEHLVELCRQSLGEGGFHLHRLGAAKQSTASLSAK